jgi:hypothetical protein
MKPLLALLALLLAACASQQPETYAPRALPVAAPMEILIETSPPGGVVDWNGNVLGAAPVTLKIRPDLTPSGRPRWPDTGANAHIFRARWPNGARAAELFMADELPPQRIAIICAEARNPLLEIIAAQNKKLTQKKTP